jgi:hypothetical protein
MCSAQRFLTAALSNSKNRWNAKAASTEVTKQARKLPPFSNFQTQTYCKSICKQRRITCSRALDSSFNLDVTLDDPFFMLVHFHGQVIQKL